MGSPPPVDAPPPEEQDIVSASAGFEAGPEIGDLCKFKLPSFLFSIGFKLPGISFPPPLPSFGLSLGLNCDLSNPISVSTSLSSGGGRNPNGESSPFE